jgi:ubiquinone/menaquinone biosynthesis C-methylase UbiE
MESTSTLSPARLTARRGDYGIDAPYVLRQVFVSGLICLALGLLALVLALLWWRPLAVLAIAGLLGGLVFLLVAAGYLYTTRLGKFRVWEELLAGLSLRGDEQVLDLGCGRGALLLTAAALLPQGKAVGVDIWSTRDQSGNEQAVTLKNAQLEGVAERVELHTADMRQLSFADNTFDLVISSLAIHNIAEGEDLKLARSGLEQALDEALRVLKPGGRLLIVDIFYTEIYISHLGARSVSDLTYRPLDWRFWYGWPRWKARLITASKPA